MYSQNTVDQQQEAWPQGFDIRAEHAEQQELLQDAYTVSLSVSKTDEKETQAA